MAIAPSTIDFPKPVLPWEWKIDTRLPNTYRNSRTGLMVIYSIENRDGDDWLHVSLSHKEKIPLYREIQLVKSLFIGDDRNAYMVFPKKETHVNTHKYCLHLWANLSNPQPLPEFSNTLLGDRQI